ncbi:MAG: hypothetical protein O2970_10480 [Proteobacteria bacterium]|nr:hypothetical protein [Pseudomonadota bacterium]MDA0967367.1 hypothetical protein [Pseudomonadota bacterium]
MNEYSFSADLLNKFSQLTPWVQAFIGVSFAGMVLGISYFFKEAIAVIMSPFSKAANNEDSKEKSQWKDKYYRGE